MSVSSGSSEDSVQEDLYRAVGGSGAATKVGNEDTESDDVRVVEVKERPKKRTRGMCYKPFTTVEATD